MPDSFDSFRRDILKWQRDTHLAAARGIAAEMPSLQTAARATELYGDDTGATRGSTVGYVIAGDGSFDQEGIADAAMDFADNRNPGSGSDDYVEVSEGEIAGFLSAFTFYAPDLENRGGGTNGFIGSTMDAMGVKLHDGAMTEIRRLLGS